MRQRSDDHEIRNLEAGSSSELAEGESGAAEDFSDPFLSDDYDAEPPTETFDFAEFSDGDSDAEFDRYFRHSEARHRHRDRGRRRERRGRSWEDAFDFGSFEDRDDYSRSRRPRR